jgi:predicted dehydrogenase
MTDAPLIPAPRSLPDAPRLRWGVLGPGGIADDFVNALTRWGTQTVTAVGSRALDRAEAFAGKHGIAAAEGSVEALVARDDVDVVYVASPHSSHRVLAEAALHAGKHVLIEKPITTTAADAEAILSLARSNGLLAMEAMWTRYLPQSDVLRHLLEDGAIGDVTFVGADFGFSLPSETPASHRLLDPAAGGGALLDAGVYPVSFISSVLGSPGAVTATGSLAATGVDETAHVVMPYTGALGVATTSLRSALPTRATVAGTGGLIEIGPGFIFGSTLTLSVPSAWGGDAATSSWRDDTFAGLHDGLALEADAAARYIAEGRTESPLHPHAETVAIIAALESSVRQLGGAGV